MLCSEWLHRSAQIVIIVHHLLCLHCDIISMTLVSRAREHLTILPWRILMETLLFLIMSLHYYFVKLYLEFMYYYSGTYVGLV